MTRLLSAQLLVTCGEWWGITAIALHFIRKNYYGNNEITDYQMRGFFLRVVAQHTINVSHIANFIEQNFISLSKSIKERYQLECRFAGNNDLEVAVF